MSRTVTGTVRGKLLMLGHASPQMPFSVYARYIPNRTRRDGSAPVRGMEGMETSTNPAEAAAAVLPKYSR
ncbi:MAG: hypothetical protein Q7W02_22840 [Candidatus Rokubacteria bacterium]|nr:hypothetical protein [Candidatus Rokubacteria bacterium]